MMNVFDIVIFILLIFGFIRGVFKGFVLGLSSFLGIVVSIYIARYFAAPVISLAESLLGVSQNISPVVGFLIVFLGALVLFHFIAVLINKFVDLVALGWLNKLLGGLLFLIKYLLIIGVALNLFHHVNSYLGMVSDEEIQKSKLYTPVRTIVPAVLPFLRLDGLRMGTQHDSDNIPEVE